MTEMPSDAEHDQLAPYLLGTLSESLRQQIDDRLLTDEPLFESLRATENELAYDYAIDLLTADDRARFEERLLQHLSMQQRVKTARDILGKIRAVDRPTTGPIAWRWHTWIPLAAAAVAVLAVGWLLRDNARLRDRLGAADSVARAAIERAEESNRVARDARQQLDSARPGTTQTSAGPVADATASPFILSMVLQPGTVRSDARAQRIRLVRGASALRLQLTLPSSTSSYSSYQVSVRTPDDVEAWSEMVPARQREGNVLIVSVPAAALPSNDYELVLIGRSAAGSVQEVASYTFSVLR